MRRILAPTLFAILLASLLVRLPTAVAVRSDSMERFDPLLESRRILLEEYVDPIDDEAASVAAVQGYVSALGDPFTSFVPPADEEAFTRSIRGEYAGIGAEVDTVEGRFTIISPMPGSPALEAGLRAGDVVLEVDDVPVAGMDSGAIVDRLTGPAGTAVQVRLERPDGSTFETAVVRRRIVAPTVRGLVRAGEGWHWCLDAAHGIRYVRVSQFNDETAEELRAALEPAAGEPFRGLVLDLRGNPGGGLPSAIRVTDLFLDEGVIVRVRPRTGEGRAYEATPGTTVVRDEPIAVLVDEDSASASEIVAGALQEAGRAIVVGTRTYGKGSVQQLRPLDTAGGTLKFTVATWELGSGRRLQRIAGEDTWGVDPDPGFEVIVSDRERIDVLLARREVEAIRESDAEYGERPFSPSDCRSIEWIEQTLGDRVLLVAARALADRIDQGTWPAPEIADEERRDRLVELRQLETVVADIEARRVEIEARIETLRETLEGPRATIDADGPASDGGDIGGGADDEDRDADAPEAAASPGPDAEAPGR